MAKDVENIILYTLDLTQIPNECVPKVTLGAYTSNLVWHARYTEVYSGLFGHSMQILVY
jgi:hypothetical protein